MAPLNDVLVSNGERTDGPNAETEVDSTTVTETAEELLAQGKRHLVCESYAEAVRILAIACSKFDETYGERSYQCAEAYYTYGDALLELGRLEPGVIGNALIGVPVDEDVGSDSESDENDETRENEPQNNGDTAQESVSTTKTDDKAEIDNVTSTNNEECAAAATSACAEEKEVVTSECTTATDEQFGDPEKLTEEERTEIHNQVEQAFAENAEEAERSNAETTASNDGQSSAVVLAEADADKSVEESEEGEQEEAGDGTENAEEEEPAEESCEVIDDTQTTVNPSNLQLAWEMLDCARLIFEKQETDEARLKAADCRVKLGEVGIADEQVESALVDLTAALDIYAKLLPNDSRKIAETYYQIGLAKSTADDYAGCAEALTKAVNTLEQRLSNLTTELDTVEDEKKLALEKEIASLKDLIPDIHAKIEDASGSQAQSDEMRKALKTATTLFANSLMSAAEGTSTEPKTAQDISHLVRKPLKRSLETTGTGEENGSPKKAKIENAANEGIKNCDSQMQAENGAEIATN